MNQMIAVVKLSAWAANAELKERLSDADDTTVRAMVREEIEELLEGRESRAAGGSELSLSASSAPLVSLVV